MNPTQNSFPSPQQTPPPANVSWQPPTQQQHHRKTILLIVGAAIAVLIAAASAIWSWAADAQTTYVTAVSTYGQKIKTARDAIDAEFTSKNLTVSSPEAPLMLEASSTAFKKVIDEAPQEPKIAWLISYTPEATRQRATALTKAASDYQQSMQQVADLFHYRASLNKALTSLQQNEVTFTSATIADFAETWDGMTTMLKNITPPSGMEDSYNALVAKMDEVAKLLADAATAFKENRGQDYILLRSQIDSGVFDAYNLHVDPIVTAEKDRNQAVRTTSAQLNAVLQ